MVAAIILTAALAYSQAGPSNPVTSSTPQLRSYTKAPTAKTRIKTSLENVGVWVDETKWKQEKSDSPHMLNLSHVNGEAWAVVMAGSTGLSTDALANLLLRGSKEADPNAKMTFEDKRIVNGRQVTAVKLSVLSEGVPFTAFGYLHGDSAGSVMVVGSSVENQFAKHLEDITELLNGLEITDLQLRSSANREVIPTPGLLPITPSASVRYDHKKWKQDVASEDDNYTFSYLSDDVSAVVISNRIPLPMDIVPGFVLAGFQTADPTATIFSQEKRSVNGTEMWFIKIDGRVENVPITYWGYFYANKDGMVGAITISRKAASDEYETDRMEFLNGLRISR
jgi:hypothetical protein